MLSSVAITSTLLFRGLYGDFQSTIDLITAFTVKLKNKISETSLLIMTLHSFISFRTFQVLHHINQHVRVPKIEYYIFLIR